MVGIRRNSIWLAAVVDNTYTHRDSCNALSLKKKNKTFKNLRLFGIRIKVNRMHIWDSPTGIYIAMVLMWFVKVLISCYAVDAIEEQILYEMGVKGTLKRI